MAASFNGSLFQSLGDLTSTEGRGLQSGMGHTYWAPNINILRDPRWGRGQETPGEDPTLNSLYAERFVWGMQGAGAGSAFLKVSSALKHFAVYSQEAGRVNNAVNVTARDMNDTYLLPFAHGVQRGNGGQGGGPGARCRRLTALPAASGIMCSYNAETYGYGDYGSSSTPTPLVPSCANKGLLTDLARTAWGFDGYITTCAACGGLAVRQPHPAAGMAQRLRSRRLRRRLPGEPWVSLGRGGNRQSSAGRRGGYGLRRGCHAALGQHHAAAAAHQHLDCAHHHATG